MVNDIHAVVYTAMMKARFFSASMVCVQWGSSWWTSL